MPVLIVLFGSWLLLRGIGALGVHALASWHVSARCALAVMFVFTGIAHFNRMKHDLARMVPPAFPQPLALVYVTGVLEFAGAIGLLLPQLMRIAAICLAVMLIGLLPANIHAAQKKIMLHGRPATPLSLRIPMQALFIGLLLWSTWS